MNNKLIRFFELEWLYASPLAWTVAIFILITESAIADVYGWSVWLVIGIVGTIGFLVISFLKKFDAWPTD